MTLGRPSFYLLSGLVVSTLCHGQTQLNELDDGRIVRIDPTTGAKAAADAEGAIFEIFRAENAPDAVGVGTEQGSGRSVPLVTPPAARELF